MFRRILLALFAAAVLAAVVPIVMLAVRSDEIVVERNVPGDVEETVEGVDTEELVATARALLSTARPWRAARAMERYLEEEPAPPDDHRVLAARAEAGWGAWPEVLALLQDVPALESYDHGIGLYLLARALDESDRPEEAVDAYRAFLALSPPAGTLEDERESARLRLALALIRTGEAEAGGQELDGLGVGDSPWFRILQADALAGRGDTAAVRALVDGLDEGMPGLRGWRARVAAARAAGDLARARSLANEARAWARTTDTRSEFLLRAGRIALEMGDVDAARDAFRTVVDMSPSGSHARAAGDLLREGDMTPADHLAVARVLDAQGLHDEAVDGFRRWLDARPGDADRPAVLMELASALFYAGEFRDAAAALRPIDDRVDARMLIARAEAHRGRIEAATDIYLDLAREHSGTSRGLEGLFLAAGTFHDDGDVERARALYRDVVRRYPGTARMGLATMRLAGMAYEEGDFAEAARLWDGYRTRFPQGDRALQATYWAARAREENGDPAGAAPLYRAVLEADRLSYYALRASQRLGEPFWPVPLDPAPAASPAADRRVAGWMREVDLLRGAGLEDAAAARADEIADEAGTDRAVRYALAEALAERGYTRRAILMGLGLQGSGPPDLRLLRILYPFPYRTLITEEARDRGLDPFIAAALIRQESMFERFITSPAGARGLMQIMPATGRRLAEAAGMVRWSPELLYHPEVNVHLGIRYVAQHMGTYEGSLPSVFSAYNAGPHRVEWWSEFPEYGDEEAFTERIPYRETRDYVKILTRNRHLYRGLYGGDTSPE
jgi:soluble lytic murein transglycosylase